MATEADLELLYDETHIKEAGYWYSHIGVKKSAEGTIDNVVKFAYADDDYEEVVEWHEYTDDELAQQAESKKQQEQAASDREFLDTAPDTLADVDAAICDLYETIIGA